MSRKTDTMPLRKDFRNMPGKNAMTWFLVADGNQAQVYVRQLVKSLIPTGGRAQPRHYTEKRAYEMVPVTGMQWKAESPEEYDIGKDQLGRVFESATPTRHMAAPHMDIREELKRRFMHGIASWMNAAHQQGLFVYLVLIAPPKQLGELKKHLSQELRSHVVAELPKELMNYERHALAAQLERVNLI